MSATERVYHTASLRAQLLAQLLVANRAARRGRPHVPEAAAFTEMPVDRFTAVSAGHDLTRGRVFHGHLRAPCAVSTVERDGLAFSPSHPASLPGLRACGRAGYGLAIQSWLARATTQAKPRSVAPPSAIHAPVAAATPHQKSWLMTVPPFWVVTNLQKWGQNLLWLR